ncbi:18530_t:CDS:10, partial [Entrophospora sp. SA101]
MYPLVDDPELDNFQKQHNILKYVWQSNFSSPVEPTLKSGGKALDVGVGIWAADVGQEYPSASITGVDIVPDFPKDHPSNVKFEKADVLKGLPFEDNSFDLVHQKFGAFAFTEQQFKDKIIDEYVRITKPGGWIELMEFDQTVVNPGETYKKFQTAAHAATSHGGLNPVPSSFLPKLVESNKDLTNYKFIEHQHPIGKWGGKLGELTLNDWLEVYNVHKPTLTSVMNCSSDEYSDMLTQFSKEIDEQKTCWMPPTQIQSNSVINSHNINNNHQVDFPVDSIISEPKLYVSDLQFSITENELRDLFEDIQPTSVQINRLPGNAPHTAVITFATIDHAEKAFAIYNHSKLDAYNTYLSLHINDPTSGIYDLQTQTNALILHVRQLSTTNTNISLFNIFRPYGPLFSVRMQVQDNKFKGSAFVQYFRKEDADKAVANLNSKDNKAMIVQYHRHNNNKAPNRPIVDPCNLFIKNLDSNISSSDLFSQFRRFGKIISARVMRDQETGNSKGFGFVSYSSSEEADKAKQSMHGKTLGAKPIVVRLHEPKKLREAKLANQFSPNTGGSARKEVLMSELQKRFKNIPSVPHDEVNYIIEYLLNLKTPEVLHILKDATALQYRKLDKNGAAMRGLFFTTDLTSSAAQVSQKEKFHKAILKICPGNVDEILELILTLSTKERRSCYFNAEYLNKRIHEAIQALEVVTNDDNLSCSPKSAAPSTEITPISTPPFIKSTESLNLTNKTTYNVKTINPITSTTTTSPTSSSTRNSEWDEIQQFMDSIKFKPVHERKQKLGDRLFRKVKSLGLKSAMASKVTINLLDTDDLYELAHSMNDNDKFREKVAAAERA